MCVLYIWVHLRYSVFDSVIAGQGWGETCCQIKTKTATTIFFCIRDGSFFVYPLCALGSLIMTSNIDFDNLYCTRADRISKNRQFTIFWHIRVLFRSGPSHPWCHADGEYSNFSYLYFTNNYMKRIFAFVLYYARKIFIISFSLVKQDFSNRTHEAWNMKNA